MAGRALERAYTSERIPGVHMTLGESINVPVGSLGNGSSMRRHGRSTSESGAALPTTSSRLPPAVAAIPADHVRGYVHTKIVNNYLVGTNLGEGSFAKVKEAFHIQVGEKVAMKVIDKKKAQQDPYVAKNFRREAKLLQMVRHVNILHLLEVIETDTSYYLVSELCSGGELMKHIYSKGRLDEVETRKYMRQIISAVDHLHRAGIIHRDLKVENMLLDGNMDLRIIDFGLSNEQYTQGENGMIHCSTQCGSPAYAAPELLGHKQYGPEVDIWSIGVNMYAMLTGCLPYTVEPFNITALHAKMLENKMNPIPDSLSKNCKSLLHRLLDANPEHRIKMDEIMTHPWINEGHTLPFGPAPFPNTLTTKDINVDIVDHMVHVLKVELTNEELIEDLMSNKATAAACVYFLMNARLERYQRKYPARKIRIRNKSIRISQDHGYFEDDDDAKSTKSGPTHRMPRPSKHTRPTQVQLRDKKSSSVDRPISHPPLSEDPESPPPKNKGFAGSRRKSLPPAFLNEQMRQFQESRPKKISYPFPSTRKPKHSTFTSQDSVEEYDPPAEMDRASLNQSLGPVYPKKGMPRNYSHGHALNQLRQDLKNKLHPPQPVQAAWRSNPGSRQGSRITSSTSTRNSSMQSGLDEDEDELEIMFHPAKARTFPREKKNGMENGNSSTVPSLRLHSPTSPEATELDDTHLPSLHPPLPSRGGRRYTADSLPKRPNGFRLNSGDAFNINSDLSVDEIITEILRVASNVKMRERELNGSTLSCNWKGVRFSMSVHKQGSQCQLRFKWFSGGDLSTYKELCERFMRKLKLT